MKRRDGTHAALPLLALFDSLASTGTNFETAFFRSLPLVFSKTSHTQYYASCQSRSSALNLWSSPSSNSGSSTEE